MKASLVGGMLFGLLLQLAPAHAEGAQVEQGFVVAPMWDESCTRFVDANLDWAARSHIGFVFTVEAATWGSRFSVTPDHELADLDISFRRERRFPWHRYETRALGGERGRVPQGVHEALVCLYIGAPTTFTYRAGQASSFGQDRTRYWRREWRSWIAQANPREGSWSQQQQ